MKKQRIITILFFLVIAATGRCQMDTIEPCQRYERYLYDSLWADDFSVNCNGHCDIRGMMWQVNFQQPSIVLRPCHSDTTLTLIGIAAPLMELCPSASYSSRSPEYFYLYKHDSTGFVQLQSIRWDTAVPRRVMKTYGYGEDGGLSGAQYYPPTTYAHPHPVYEAYFDKPVQISGDFYVGGSNNSGRCGSDGFGGSGSHPLTLYVRWACWTSASDCWQTLPHPETTDLVMYTGESSTDTTFHSNYMLWPGFGCIFPILQLPGDSIPSLPDTCLGTRGLSVLDVSGRNATLTWNDDGTASQWELAVVKGDTATATPENGIVNSYGSNLAQFYSLDSAWYTVFLRTVCNADRGMYSEWSDTVRFQIPSPDTAEVAIPQSPADSYTVVSPNPTDGRVEIFSPFEIGRVTVVAANGQTVLTQPCSGHTASLDLAGLPSGAYFVQIRTTTSTVTKKLMVK